MALGKRVFKIHSISHFAMILSKSIMVHPSNHPSNHPSIHPFEIYPGLPLAIFGAGQFLYTPTRL